MANKFDKILDDYREDDSTTSIAWGSLTGTLSSQTDLQTALNAKQNSLTLGSTLQYFRGDLSLATFPTKLSSFTNDIQFTASAAGSNTQVQYNSNGSFGGVSGATTDGTTLSLTNPTFVASSGALATTLINGLVEGRLTLTTALPVTISDVTATGTLRFTPYKGNRMALYSGSVWKLYTFSELSLALSVTSGYLYSIFAYDNSGTITLESAEWDNSTVTITLAAPGVVTWTGHPLSNGNAIILSTTGALPTGLTAGTVYYVINQAANTFQLAATQGGTAITTSVSQSGTHTAHSLNTNTVNLTLQDGVYVKSGATTRRYLGDIRASGSNITEDSLLKRYVWNYYNQVTRRLKAVEATDTWTYATNAWRYANNSSANRFEFIRGIQINPVMARALITTDVEVNEQSAIGIGLDSSTVNSNDLGPVGYYTGAGVVRYAIPAFYNGFPGAGYHFLAWLERAPSGTISQYGFVSDYIQSGIIGELQG